VYSNERIQDYNLLEKMSTGLDRVALDYKTCLMSTALSFTNLG